MKNLRHSAQTLLVAAICLVAAGCGGSSHATSATSSTSSTTSSATATSAPTTISSTAVTSSNSSAPSGTTPSATTGTTTTSSSSRSTGGSTNVRVPATFVIRAGGRLVPPQITAPAFLAVQVSVASADGRPHRVLLKTPQPRTLTVPAHGRAAVLLRGMRAGQYQILVDGAARGVLVIGGEPGP